MPGNKEKTRKIEIEEIKEPIFFGDGKNMTKNELFITMDKDPGILCFKHCNAATFCKSLPSQCSVCGVVLKETTGLIPFRIPYPFVQAYQTPCSILLKPTDGDFLNVYTVDADLHIGITSSSCTVFEYDIEGLSTSKTHLWNESLVVYILEEASWHKKWDNVLKVVSEEFTQSGKRYSEDNWNCYSFVLSFVKRLQHKDFSQSSKSKEIFCKDLVIPCMAVACKYVFLFRKLLNSEYYVEE